MRTCDTCGEEQPGQKFHGNKCHKCKANDTRKRTAAKRASNPAKKRGYSFKTAQEWIDLKTRDRAEGAPGWGGQPKLQWFPNGNEHTIAVTYWKLKSPEGDASKRGRATQQKRCASGELKATRIKNGTYRDSRVCQHQGCNVSATWGENGKREYCVEIGRAHV